MVGEICSTYAVTSYVDNSVSNVFAIILHKCKIPVMIKITNILIITHDYNLFDLEIN